MAAANPVQLKAGDKVALQPGMRIRFLHDFPDYVVDRIDPGVIAVTLHRADDAQLPQGFTPESFPKTITITDDCLIGRNPEADWRLRTVSGAPDRRLSNDQAYVHFSPERNCWYYEQYGINPSLAAPPDRIDAQLNIITAATTKKEEDKAAHETVRGPGNPSAGIAEPLKIIDGMTFQFAPAAPIYCASIKPGPKGAVLMLTPHRRQPDSKRYPEIVAVQNGIGAAIGRLEVSGMTRLINPRISRFHATIQWSSEENGFIYTPWNGMAPCIRVPDLCEEREKRYKARPFTKEQAQQQLPEVEALLRELSDYKPQARIAQGQERHTQLVLPEERGKGADTEDSQKGYEMWLRAYELLHREQLKPEASQKLLKMAAVIRTLGEDRQELAKIEDPKSFPKPNIAENLEKLKEGPRGHAVAKYIDDKCTALMQTGEVYILSGYHKHHALTHIKKDDAKGGYLVRTYDAASGEKAGSDHPGKVLGMTEKHLKITDTTFPEKDARNFIWLTTELRLTKLRSETGIALVGKIHGALGPTEHAHAVWPQKRQNCTTRSTREMVKDVLRPEHNEVFKDLHKHVCDPNRTTPDDLEDALRMKYEHLAKALYTDIGPASGHPDNTDILAKEIVEYNPPKIDRPKR